MYYEILVNGASLGVFGHDQIDSLSLAVQVCLGRHEIFASAVCKEDEALFLYDWLQHPVEPDDVVEFRRAKTGPSRPPRMKRKMRNLAGEPGSNAA